MTSIQKIWKSLKSHHIIFLVLVGLAVYLGSRADIIDYFSQFIGNDFIGVTFFIVVFALATILVPLTGLPLIVPGSAVFGTFLVSIYSIIGWTIGAIIAFFIARYLGRPVLAFFVPIEKIEKYEQYFSGKIEFWGLVLLRMVLPVDIISYVVGLLSRISFKKYLLATILGITPFAFIFAYIGDALIEKQYFVFTLLTMGAIILFGFIYFIYRIYKIERKIGHSRDNQVNTLE